ncbi:MAG: hypothetical protein PVI66_16000 [Candidatus Aminicenantes bacterium]|jgi:hypothetical protein
MKKNLSFKLLSLITILTVILVFIGIDFVQGQVTTHGKPPGKGKPGSYTWSAVILDGYGIQVPEPYTYNVGEYQGWLFNDSDPNVMVRVEIRSAPFDGVEKYWTRFHLELFPPIQIDLHIDIHEAHFYNERPDEEMCIYPEDIEGLYPKFDPYSMLRFMQRELHPHSEYESVYFRFNSALSVNQDEVDYRLWPNQHFHEHLKFLCDIFGRAPNMFKPATCEELNLFEYSHIEFGGDNEYGYIQRLDEDIWKVVGIGVDKPGWATDWYQICELTEINKNKTSASYDAIFSSKGSMDIGFEILFIRTKQ